MKVMTMTTNNPYNANELVQAAVCSEANFSHWADPRGVELEVARILHPSPPNEHFEELGGIFHADNRYYLQVIEGPPASVDWYLEQLEADERHRGVRMLSTQPIKFRRFKPGHLRFVGTQRQMHLIQEQVGQRTFDPYRYDETMIEAFINLAQPMD
jgi:hypothetical protein